MSDSELRQEIERLRAEIAAANVWADGIYLLLQQVLPPLLSDHPSATDIRQMLRHTDERYEELLAHPARAEEGETAGQYEASKMLHRQLEILAPTDSSARSIRQIGG